MRTIHFKDTHFFRIEGDTVIKSSLCVQKCVILSVHKTISDAYKSSPVKKSSHKRIVNISLANLRKLYKRITVCSKTGAVIYRKRDTEFISVRDLKSNPIGLWPKWVFEKILSKKDLKLIYADEWIWRIVGAPRQCYWMGHEKFMRLIEKELYKEFA